jgi:hypothetical protein
MKTKILICVVLLVILLAACSPNAASSYAPVSTFSSILPVAQSTPALEPGSTAAQAYSVVEAYQDGFSVGRNWSVRLNQGEKAYLDQDDNILQVDDTQGRVMLESLGNDYIRVYAWEGGYDVNVGSGYVLLTAGNSYTQKLRSVNWDKEVVEVRQISDDQQIGYILLMKNYESSGSFTGYETPIAFIDANGDGIISIQELDAALSHLRAEVLAIGKSQPALAEGFIVEINSAYASINSGAIADAYLKIKQIEPEITSATQTAKTTMNGTYFVVLIVVVVGLFLGVFWLKSRRKQQMRGKQQQNRNLPAQPQTNKNGQNSQFRRIANRRKSK